MVPENLKFSKDHEWVKVEGEEAVIGITDYAQHELGDVVFVDLPAVGKSMKKGDPCANIESVKAVSDVYSPIAGSVIATNSKLSSSPELINQEPYGEGWVFRIKVASPAELNDLLGAKQYEDYLKGIAGE